MKSKLLKAAILIWIILTVLRETGLITLSLYKLTIRSHSNMDGTQSTSIIKPYPTNPDYEDEAKRVFDTCNRKTFNEFPVVIDFANDDVLVIIDKDSLQEIRRNTFAKLDSCNNNILITIKNISYGPVWMPLVKSAAFHAKGILANTNTISFLSNSGTVQRALVHFDIQFKIAGHIKIIGICSYRYAKKTIRAHIAKSILEDVRKRLSKVDAQ